jgi:hydroxyacylglutathione hydrolase
VEYEHDPLADGDAIEVGRVWIVALANPGHRLEYTTLMIEHVSRDEVPWLILARDSRFVNNLAGSTLPSGVSC